MVAYYDEKPNVFSKTNTQITYRWDIIEEIPNHQNNNHKNHSNLAVAA